MYFCISERPCSRRHPLCDALHGGGAEHAQGRPAEERHHALCPLAVGSVDVPHHRYHAGADGHLAYGLVEELHRRVVAGLILWALTAEVSPLASVRISAILSRRP